MKPGDLVKLIPEDEDDDYEGLIGLIVSEELGVMGTGERLFNLIVNGVPGWRMNEDSLEVISGE